MTPLYPGDRLDHYSLEALVARGGMASVFRAVDTRTGCRVAIKVPHPEAECDIAFYDRFQREALIGRELDHPGILKVLPEEPHSRVYMVMEWVEGRSLRDVVAGQGRLPCDRAARIATGICDALAYIHAHGVVHRDLKPENIILDAHDRIQLIDFGIAAKSGARRLTFGKLSNVMGTADYISPEQVKGRRGDARSDIYALGAVLYEMLTGQTPFAAAGPNPFAVMNARLKTVPVPPRQLLPELPAPLDAIIVRALERDPQNRYQSAADLAGALANPDRTAPPRKADRVIRATAPTTIRQKVLVYGGLAMLPASIFLLMLLVARAG